MANNKKDFAVDALAVLIGAGAGVVADKVVGDALLAGNIPNPQVSSIQTHDVVLAGSELMGAYALKNSKPTLSKLLLGMAAAVVVTDIYEYVAGTGQWVPSLAANGYAGPVNPKASAYTPPVEQKQILDVGTTGSGGKVVYKPNVPRDSRAGENADNPLLWV